MFCPCSEAHVQKQVDALLKQAREKKKKGDRKGALFCLKKRKMLSAQIDKLQAARLNLETMQLTIGSAKYAAGQPSPHVCCMCVGLRRH